MIFDGRNIFDPKQMRDARLHLLVDRPAMSVVLVTGGAGYVGSHAVKALAAAGYDVVVYDDLSAGHAEAIDRIAARGARRGTISLVEGDILDARARARGAAARPAPAAVMHFAARLLVGESVREPFGYYRTNVDGHADACWRRWPRRRREVASCSRPRAPRLASRSTVPIDETHPQRPDQCVRRDRSWRSNARCRTSSARSGIRSIALRYFNAAGADPDGLIGEDHEPEEHLIPLAIRRRARRPAAHVFGDDYDTPDGTCVRDYVHVTDLADAHLASLERLEQGGPPGFFNLGNGDGHVGAAGDRRRRTRRGPARAAQRRRPTAGRSGAAGRVERAGPRRARLDAALRETSRPLSAPRGSGIRGHAERVSVTGTRVNEFRRLLHTPGPIGAAWRSRSSRWWSTPAGRAGLRLADQADLRQRAAAATSDLGRVGGADPRAPTSPKGSARTSPSFLMADVGQRVVRDLRNRAVPAHPRSVGGVLLAPDVGPTGLAHHQRRQPGPDRRLRDARRPDPRVAGGRRLTPALLFYLDWQLALVVHDGGAARGLPARAARDSACGGRRGAARKSSSTSRTSPPRPRRPSHRQGVRRRGAGSRAVQRGRREQLYRTNMKITGALSALPPIMEFIGGLARGRRALVRRDADRAERAHAGRLRRRFWPRRS